ncbi:related to glutathione transferase omega 1 [Phialocephala subalpina]|uniref:Related to glutathione transferase omega 1 n=1 Tax=Phialocephala subalpina TaxID=576137 RepID=A0A1L7XAY4_9HELO|nr:related to glutathione transferase omega 1 [Phialocephala subalpina]
MGSTESPKIILYTNHGCPWAHRAHIALTELGLPFTEEIIDLSTPRTAEYLKINPRGLVPSLSYNGTIITESGIVAQFLADAHPSHLEKTSSEEGGALQRARVNFFVDAYFSKVNSNFYPILKAEGAEKEEHTQKYVDAVVKELEPLLQDAAPYFGGSSKLTLAEVLTGSFLLRVLTHGNYPELKLIPKSLTEGLQERAPKFWKWASAVIQDKGVTASIWDEKGVAERTASRVEKMKAAK